MQDALYFPSDDSLLTEADEVDRVLASIPGIDLECALKIANGKRERLLKFLRHFREEHHEELQRIADACAQGKRDEAVRMAHTLKGLLGTFCLTGLQQQAAAVEGALRADNGQADALLDAMRAGYATLMAAIPSPAQSMSNSEKGTTVDWRELRTQLQPLRASLVASDTQSTHLFEELRPRLKAAIGNQADALGRLIDNFEYEKALRRLDEIGKKGTI